MCGTGFEQGGGRGTVVPRGGVIRTEGFGKRRERSERAVSVLVPSASERSERRRVEVCLRTLRTDSKGAGILRVKRA